MLVKAKGFTKGWETLIKKSLNEDRRSPLFSCSLAPCCPFTGIVCSFLRSCLHAVEVFILLPFALAFLMLPIRYAPWSCSLFPSVPCSSLFFVSCTMSSSATEDGSPVWGRSLLAKEVRGIGESGSDEEFFVLSPSSIFDSERTKDFLVSVGEGVEVCEEMEKMG